MLLADNMLKIYKYSKNLIKIFEKQYNKLSLLLGNDCIIEHIGSTAIDGVDGKGVIDIMVAVNNQKDVNRVIEILGKNKYYLANFDSKRQGRILMTSVKPNKESDKGDIHIHVVLKTHPSFIEARLFRDFLKTHPQEKQEYIDLKYRLLNLVKDNRPKYTLLKSDFIKKIINKAKTK